MQIFSGISWLNYLAFVGSATILYYFVISYLFFPEEIRQFISEIIKKQKAEHPESAIQAPIQTAEKYEEDFINQYFESDRESESAEYIEETDLLIDTSGYIEEELLDDSDSFRTLLDLSKADPTREEQSETPTFQKHS